MNLLFTADDGNHDDAVHPVPDQLLLLSAAGLGLVRAGLGHHLESRLVDDIQQVLGVNSEGVRRRQHLFLVVLLETETERKEYTKIYFKIYC